MPLTRAHIHRLSRDRGTLIKLALVIGAVCGLIGLILGRKADPMAQLVASLGPRAEADSVSALLEAIHAGVDEGDPAFRRLRHQAMVALVTSHLDDAGESERAQLYADALFGEGAAAAAAQRSIAELAATESPPVGVNYALGDIRAAAGRIPEAEQAFEREAVLHASVSARQRLLELATSREDADRIRTLLTRPELSDGLPAGDTLRARAIAKDWPGLAAACAQQLGERARRPSLALVALFCGGLWVTIVSAAGFIRWRQTLALLPATLLGACAFLLVKTLSLGSPPPFSATGAPGEQLLHHVLGDALRGESLKLFCCIPLIILLRRAQSEAVVMVGCALVGLGYSLAQGLDLVGYGSAATWTYFVLQNFAHMAWTGVLGHALWAALVNRRHAWERLGGQWLLAIVAHGLFQAFNGALFENEPTSYFAGVIFVLSGYVFFHQLRPLVTVRRITVSPLAVFVVGSALLLGISFILMAATTGSDLTIRVWTPTFVGVAPLAFLFINEFRDA